jgi:hypothetical protein
MTIGGISTVAAISTTSTIANGANGATVTLTGSNFKTGIAASDLTIGGSGTGLTIGTVTRVSATELTIPFTGTAAAGTLTIQAKTSAFEPAGAAVSNTLTITVPAPTSITFTSVTANGTSDTVSTTELVITLSADINLDASDITLTGATKGDLIDNNNNTYNLPISNITVGNGADVKVALSKAGFAFSPTDVDVAVNVDTTAPVVGASGAITTASLTDTTLTLNWTKATDAAGQANLKYFVYRSEANDMGTVSNTKARTLLNASGTLDINTLAVTGLTAGTAYYFNVLVVDEAGNESIYVTVAVAADRVAPVVGASGAITTANVAATSLTLNWTKASDVVTSEANLRYFVYQSSANNITTVADAELNGTLLNTSGTLDIDTLAVTGLTTGTTYYFNVVVVDQAGNKSAYVTEGQATS